MLKDELDAVELVAGMYEAFTNGSVDGVAATLSEDVVWHVVRGNDVEDVVLSSKETVARFLDLEAWQASTDDDSFGFGELQIDAQGSQVIARHSATATIDGVDVADRVVSLFRIGDGGISEVWQSFEDHQPWQGTWTGAGATSGLPVSFSGTMMGPAAVVAAAYAAVDPWDEHRLRHLFDPNIQWTVTLKSGKRTFSGIDHVLGFLMWPGRVHLVANRLAIASRHISQISQTEVEAHHTLVLGLATHPDLTDTVSLTLKVVNSLITDVVQTFGHPEDWPF